MPEKISIVKESGETISSNIVSVFTIPDTEKKYIITTENAVDPHGLTVLHVSEIVDGELKKVATDEEWSSIKTIMRAIISGNVGSYKYLPAIEVSKAEGQYSRDISVSASASKQMIDNYAAADLSAATEEAPKEAAPSIFPGAGGTGSSDDEVMPGISETDGNITANEQNNPPVEERLEQTASIPPVASVDINPPQTGPATPPPPVIPETVPAPATQPVVEAQPAVVPPVAPPPVVPEATAIPATPAIPTTPVAQPVAPVEPQLAPTAVTPPVAPPPVVPAMPAVPEAIPETPALSDEVQVPSILEAAPVAQPVAPLEATPLVEAPPVVPTPVVVTVSPTENIAPLETAAPIENASAVSVAPEITPAPVQEAATASTIAQPVPLAAPEVVASPVVAQPAQPVPTAQIVQGVPENSTVTPVQFDPNVTPSFKPDATLDEVVKGAQDMFMEGVKNLVQTIQEKVYRELYVKEAELKKREALVSQKEQMLNTQFATMMSSITANFNGVAADQSTTTNPQ